MTSQPSDIHTLAGAYALDALTEIERVGFARHLAGCEACSLEVAELAQAAARLGATAQAVPPPRLREAVLTEVSRTRQVSAGARTGGDEQIAVRRWRRWTAAAAAAGIVALGGMAGVWAVQQARVDRAQAEAASLRGVLAAGDAVVRSSRMTGGGNVTLAFSPSRDDGVVVLSDLPAPPDGKAYQLWLIRGSAPMSAGVLAAGQRSATVALTTLSAADSLGVTIEPAGGSPAPTQAPIVSVSLA